ncbi:MAG: hypothetical protein ACTSXG_02270 [Alphaproteobacteria bacterium]
MLKRSARPCVTFTVVVTGSPSATGSVPEYVTVNPSNMLPLGPSITPEYSSSSIMTSSCPSTDRVAVYFSSTVFE